MSNDTPIFLLMPPADGSANRMTAVTANSPGPDGAGWPVGFTVMKLDGIRGKNVHWVETCLSGNSSDSLACAALPIDMLDNLVAAIFRAGRSAVFHTLEAMATGNVKELKLMYREPAPIHISTKDPQ